MGGAGESSTNRDHRILKFSLASTTAVFFILFLVFVILYANEKGDLAIVNATPIQFGVASMSSLSGALAAGVPNVAGTIRFLADANGHVTINATITGLVYNGTYGFHIHSFGDITSRDGLSAGGHYNPNGYNHGCPANGVDGHIHAGDMGSLRANFFGVAQLYSTTMLSQVGLGGQNSIIGRSVVLHAKPDDCVSQPTGNAGSRIAVGVIGICGVNCG